MLSVGCLIHLRWTDAHIERGDSRLSRIYAWAVHVREIAWNTLPYLAKEYADLIVLATTLIVVMLPLALNAEMLDSIVALYSIPLAFGAVCVIRELVELVKWLDSKM